MARAAAGIACALCLLSVGLSRAAPTQPPGALPVDATATVDKTQITVGDVLTYTVVVTCPDGTRVTAPDDAKALAPFEIRECTQKQGRQKGKSVIALIYRLVIFEVGERTLGGLKLECLLPGEKAPRRLTAPPVKVSVASVLPPDAQDIKDIRGPVPVRMSGREWATVLLGLLLLAAVVAAVVLLVLRRRRRPRATPLIVIQAHERALRELDRLAGSNLLPRGDLLAYYKRLSDIVREYLEARFGIAAMGETTWMIRRDLERQGVPVQWRTGFAVLLQAADLVKFAREEPSDQQAEDALREARQLVIVSRAVPEPAEREVEAAVAVD